MILEKAMKRATTDKGISYYSLNSELRKAGSNAQILTTTLAQGGTQFQASLNAANTALAMSNRQVISLNSKIKEMSRVMVQSFKFTAAQTVIRGLSSQMQEAVRWTTDLYDAVNEIGIVTGKTGVELEAVTQQSIVAAKNLRVAAKEYAEGSLIFYQQGLSDDEVSKRTEVTVKAAKASGESISQMSSELTSIWNNYKMVGEEQQRAASVGAKMAAQTAVDFGDIAEAMQTAAAPAAQMGVSYDSLAAIIATVGDTTQQSASVIGNAFKTIFSRFQQLKSEGTDGEVTLNRVSSQLQELGVNVLDTAGELRPLENVIHEVGDSWESWSSKQQLAIAQLVGGTRQYGQFLALMNNYDKYQDNLKEAQAEDGSTLEQQYGQYLESIESYAENAGEAWNRAFSEVIDPDAIKSIYKISEGLGNTVGTILDALGGAPGLLLTISTLLSGKIVPSLIRGATNAKELVTNLTATGRQNNIKKDYANQTNAIQGRMNQISKIAPEEMTVSLQNEQASLALQKEKIQVNQQFALVNDEINTKLQTATGAYKINLEYQKQQLAIAQQEYQAEMDKLAALEKQGQLRASKVVTKEQVDAQTAKVGQAQGELDDAKTLFAVSETKEDKAKAREQMALATAKLSTEQQKLNALLENYDGHMGNLDKQVIKVSQSLAGWKTGTVNVEALKEEMISLAGQVTGSQDEFEKMEAIIKSFSDKSTKEIQEMIMKLKQLSTTAGATEGTLSYLDDTFNSVENVDTSSKKPKEVKKTPQVTPEEPAKIDYGQMASGMVELSMSAGMLTASLTSLFSIMNDEQMSFGQKLIAFIPLIGQLLMSLQMIVSAANTLSVVMKKSQANSVALTAARTAEAKATEALAAAEAKLNAAKAGGASKGTVSALKGVVTKKKNALTEATAAREALQAQTLSGKLAGGIGRLGAKLKALPGLIAGAGKAFLAAFMPVAPMLAVVAGVIAAISVAVVLLYDNWKKNDPGEQLKQTKEAAEGLKKQVDEAKSAADELASSFDNYKNARKQLEECTKGTQEWEEALRGVNSAALEVLDNLPSDMTAEEIRDLYSRDENGMIKFDEDKMNNVQEEAQNRVDKAQFASSSMDNRVVVAQNRVDGEKLLKEMLGYTPSDYQLDNFMNHIEELDGLTGGELKTALQNFGIYINGTSDELDQWTKDVDSLSNKAEAAAEKFGLIADLNVDQMLGDEYDSETKDIVGDSVAAKENKIYEDTLSWLTGGDFQQADWASDDEAIASLVERYAKARDMNYSKGDNFVQGMDGDRYFSFLNEETGKEEKYSAKQVAETIAAAEALEGLTSSAEATSKSLNKLDTVVANTEDDVNTEENEKEKAERRASNIKNYLTSGNTNSMTQAELESFSGMTDAEIKTWLAEAYGVPESELEQIALDMGQSSSQAWIDGMQAAADESKKLAETVGSELTETPKAIFDKLKNDGAFSDIAIEGQQAIANTMQQVFNSDGSAGLETFEGILTTLGPEADDFAANLKNIDFTDASPESLRQQLIDFGITTDLTETQLYDLIELMDKGSNIDLATAQEQFSALQEIVNGLDFGGVIDEAQMQQLTDLNPALASYFTMMADGTYQLTGDASEFKSVVDSLSMQPLYQAHETAYQEAEKYSHAAGLNYDMISDSEKSNNGLNDNRLKYLEATGYDPGQIQEWREQLQEGKLDVDAVTAAIQATGDKTEELKTKAGEAAQKMQEIEDAMAQQDFSDQVEKYGLDLEETSSYAERLKDSLDDTNKSEEDQIQLSRDAAIANQRLNRGIKDINDNLKDYKKKLDPANKGTFEWSKTMDDFKDSLADIFNVADGDLFSDDFGESMLTDGDFQKALQGDEEALDRLRVKAAEDIVVKIKKNAEMTPEQLASYESAWEKVKTALQGDITVPGVNQTNFISGMNEMISAAGMTKEQVQSLLGSMGVSAKINTTYEKTMVEVPVYEERTKSLGSDPYTEEYIDYDEQGNATVQTQTINKPRIGHYSVQTGTVKTEGLVPVVSIESVSGDYSSGGDLDVGSQIDSSSVPTGDSGSGGGGSGGGGSAPKHSAKKPAKREKVKDRYGTVKASIDKVANSLNKLNDASDDAFGAAKIRNLEKVNLELQKQGRNLQKLRDLAKGYAKADQKDANLARLELFKNLSDEELPALKLGGIEFNEDDFVKNRTEITAQLDAYLESLYQPYYEAAKAYDKANSVDEKESERIDNLKERYETAKQFVDEFLAALDLVDESAEEAKQALLDELENIRTWMSNKVEAASFKMELQIDINETDIALLDHMIDKWGDLGVTTGKTWNWLNESMTKNMSSLNAVMANSRRMEEILTNIDPENPQFQAGFIEQFGEEAWDEYLHSNGALPQEVMDQMAQNADDMISYLDAMYDNAEEMLSQYMTIFDSYIDRFDQISTKIQQQNDELDMYTQLLEVSGQKWGASGREARKNIADARVDNAAVEVDRASAQLKLAKQAAEETQGQLQDFYDQYGTDPQNYTTAEAFMYNKLKEASDSAQDALSDAQSGMTQAISDMADAAAQAIEEMAQVIKEETIENLGGDFADFSEMTNMYDQQYNLDHFFLEDYDKNYQLNKLLGEIDDSMADITDPERLKEYQSLIDDINAANQEGVDITQTDVDLLNARFEIQKAMDAYEEAVNAKNTMRLARDASGNWNYVYSTDESQTEDAAQKLADAQYNYEKLLHEARDESEQYWIQAQQEFFEWQEGIDQARLETDAKYREQIKQQYEYYQRMTELHTGQVNKYNEMLGAKFEETTLGIILNTNSLDEAQSQYTAQHEQYHDKLKENTQKYGDKVKEVCENAGIDYDNLANEVREKTEDMQDSNNALKENIQNLYSEGSQALSDMNARVSEWKTGFIRSMNEAEAAVASLIAKLQELRNAQLAEANHTGFDMGTDYTAKIHNYIGAQIQNGATAEDLENDETLRNMIIELKNKLTDQTLKDAGHTTVVDRWGQQGPNFVQNYLEEMIAEVFEQIENKKFKTWDEIDEWVQNNWDKINAARNGETYTGGLITTPQVRSLAEKGPELVLNTEDTKNILETVKTMRETIRMKMSSAIANISKQTETPAEKAFGQQPVQTIDQNVSIDATFPNVSVASEIEEALNNLINQAVQYATRNNR